MKTSLKFILTSGFLIGLILNCACISNLYAEEQLKEGLYYEKLDKKVVHCHICPRNCVIPDGKRGFCGVRENRGGTLYALSYGRLVAIHLDPIEKKPLFHFLPGSYAFSIATAGCNFRCKFCQNWEISQRKPDEVDYSYIEPQDLIKKVKESGSYIIAYTYTEPTIFYEYMLDVAKLAKKEGIRNIMHSCGYINEKPLRALAKYLDAANIDLKGFSEDYYAKISEGSLGPVLAALKILKEEGVHVEITNLVLPGYNDDPGMITRMCLWIKDNLGADTPLHFSRFFPSYKLLSLNPTPVSTLEKARRIALDCGLKYVYIGNVVGNPAENTYCPRCKKIVVERSGYTVLEVNLKNGRCKFCGEKIEGVWK
ncbi:MAG: AmmeMemoRadiSam system radical SAM enzyme [Candidatus Omnitrophota bacterium]